MDIINELLDFWKEKDIDSVDNLKELRRTKFVPFVGAGMSASFGYPMWRQFLRYVINTLPSTSRTKKDEFRNLLKANEFLELAGKIDVLLNGGITELVRTSFSDNKYCTPTLNYVELLLKNGVYNFITTNYDTVIERQMPENSMKVVFPDNCRCAIDFIRNSTPFVLKLHGSIEHLNGIILTDAQYKRYYNVRNNDIKNTLKHFWTSQTLLFLGCSLEKDYLVDYMYKLASRSTQINHYAIVEMPKTKRALQKKKMELTQLKIRPIFYPNGKHESIYTILSLLFNDDFDDTISKSSKSQYNINFFDCFVDQLAKTSIDNAKTDSILKIILKQADESIAINSVEEMINIIKSTNSHTSMRISGDPGTGKSTLMSLLFLEWTKYDSSKIPALIDLYHYDGKETEKSLEDLQKHINYIDSLIEEKNNVIVFVDGLSSYQHIDNSLESKLYHWIKHNQTKPNFHLVYSVGTLDENCFPPFQLNTNISQLNRAEKEIVLHPINVSTKKFSEVIIELLRFCYITNIENNVEAKDTKTIDKLIMCCKKICCNKIEIRSLLLMINLYKAHGNIIFSSKLGEVFKNHYTNLLGTDSLSNTARYTTEFMLNITPKCDISSKYFVFKSPTIRNFLFAYHYVEMLKQQDFEAFKIFDCVFTPLINRFVVDFITSNSVDEENLTRIMINNYDRMTVNQKSQIVYLLGRVKSNKAKRQAINFLLQLYNREKDKTFSSLSFKEILMFRSIGVSLIYFKKTEIEDDFYKKLMYCPELRMINRNFHILYYSTDEYKIGDDLNLQDQSISSSDNIQKLYNFLYHSITDEKHNTTKNLNIITIINLVIYDRYINHNSSNPNGFNKLLCDLSSDTTITNDTIKNYVTTINDAMLNQNIYSATLEKIYSLKKIQREGWKKPGRDIHLKEQPESVADHTWGCCQIAQIFLTNDIEQCEIISNNDKELYKQEYNKEHIIAMLHTHDFSEIYVGDIPSDQKSIDQKQRENVCMQSTLILDSFPYFHSYNEILSLWQEYESQKTFNSRIAFDIDKLEPLIQLHIYRNLLPPETAIHVKTNWLNDVESKIKTDFGRNMLKFLKQQLFS